ncbi:MAG: hypothetical protein ACFE0J_00920 [Elainellaceae cyanobacterium]
MSQLIYSNAEIWQDKQVNTPLRNITMQSQDSYTQLTFHYLDGKTESFNVYASLDDAANNQEVQLEVRHILKKDWWILNLPEQTVFINIDNVIKVEVKPPLPQLHGEDVFSNAERVTALNRMR